MANKVIIVLSMLMGFALADLYAAEVTLGPDLKIPPYYKLSSSGRCTPGEGYVLVPQAPAYPFTFPTMNLRVFNGEVIGFMFEVEPKEGWRPWYDQPEGKPIKHGDGPLHYQQTIYIKKGPTAEECKASKGPYGQ